MDELDKTLSHIGVKGMKWGVHTKQGKVELTNVAKTGVAALKARRAPNQTKVAFNQKVSTSGGLHKVDDKALQAMISRMEMERKYSNFMAEEAVKRKEGQKAALKFLGEVGKVALPLVIGALAGRAAASPGATKAYAHFGRAAVNVSRKAIGM